MGVRAWLSAWVGAPPGLAAADETVWTDGWLAGWRAALGAAGGRLVLLAMPLIIGATLTAGFNPEACRVMAAFGLAMIVSGTFLLAAKPALRDNPVPRTPTWELAKMPAAIGVAGQGYLMFVLRYLHESPVAPGKHLSFKAGREVTAEDVRRAGGFLKLVGYDAEVGGPDMITVRGADS